MKAGFVAMIGLPNAGKSTLVNKLIGEKVSIVSAKPQTTRKQALGIYTSDQAQVIFVDTPGLIHAEEGLNHYLQLEMERSLQDADVALALLNLDATSFESLQRVIDLVRSSKKPVVAVITKTDLPQVHRIPKIQSYLEELGVPCLTSSHLRSTQQLREDILATVIEKLPETDAPLYPIEEYTNQTLKQLSGEIVREKCFEQLHEEVPFGLAVDVRKFDDDSGKVVKIYADLILNKENHKPMVVGRGGQRVRDIGKAARLEMEKLLARPVYLELLVRVKKNWIKDVNALRELGYEYRS